MTENVPLCGQFKNTAITEFVLVNTLHAIEVSNERVEFQQSSIGFDTASSMIHAEPFVNAKKVE